MQEQTRQPFNSIFNECLVTIHVSFKWLWAINTSYSICFTSLTMLLSCQKQNITE